MGQEGRKEGFWDVSPRPVTSSFGGTQRRRKSESTGRGGEEISPARTCTKCLPQHPSHPTSLGAGPRGTPGLTPGTAATLLALRSQVALFLERITARRVLRRRPVSLRLPTGVQIGAKNAIPDTSREGGRRAEV